MTVAASAGLRSETAAENAVVQNLLHTKIRHEMGSYPPTKSAYSFLLKVLFHWGYIAIFLKLDFPTNNHLALANNNFQGKADRFFPKQNVILRTPLLIRRPAPTIAGVTSGRDPWWRSLLV